MNKIEKEYVEWGLPPFLALMVLAFSNYLWGENATIAVALLCAAAAAGMIVKIFAEEDICPWD